LWFNQPATGLFFMRKKVLFVTWDGPQTSYMEGLFLPIYHEIQSQSDYEFHVVQFTWGDAKRRSVTAAKASDLGITYTAQPIFRKPHPIIGSFFSVGKGIRFLNRYVRTHDIDIVMPRSTMPALMVNRMRKGTFKIVFDADGLALEERVDFSGLSPESRQYRFLKQEETKMLRRSDLVLTRSQKAVAIHLKTIGKQYADKFSVVSNGRDVAFFKPNPSARQTLRGDLGFSPKDFVFVYCGSLGAQYGWGEMLQLFEEFRKTRPDAQLLLLTGNPEYTDGKIPEHLQCCIRVKSVPFAKVPEYLSVADIAFAIREPRYSMQGVAPIKLGEYLLMGLPTIASAGIGDTEALLHHAPHCLLYDHQAPNMLNDCMTFLGTLDKADRTAIRDFGKIHFSLAKSARSYIASFDKIAHICND